MVSFPNLPKQSGSGFVYIVKLGENHCIVGSTDNPHERDSTYRTHGTRFHKWFETVEFTACEEYLKANLERHRKSATKEEFLLPTCEIEKAIVEAIAYAKELAETREIYEQTRTNSELLAPLKATPELRKLCRELQDLEADVMKAAVARDRKKLELAVKIGDCKGIQALISYDGFKSTRLRDAEELATILRDKHPDLYRRFWRAEWLRQFRWVKKGKLGFEDSDD